MTSPHDQVGQLFMIGFEGTTVSADLASFIRDYKPAGVILFSRNLESIEQIVVIADRDVDFHYLVNGLRRGYRDHQSIAANENYVPRVRGVPFGTQYRPAVRQMLIDNGTLNADLTPNEGTAARLAWTLRDSEARIDESTAALRRPRPVRTDSTER